METTPNIQTALKEVTRVPVALAESWDKVALLVFRVEEENRPVQGPVLVQEDLRPRSLFGAEAIQAQLCYRCQRSFIFILAVWTMPMSLHRLEELDASLLNRKTVQIVKQKKRRLSRYIWHDIVSTPVESRVFPILRNVKIHTIVWYQVHVKVGNTLVCLPSCIITCMVLLWCSYDVNFFRTNN